MAGSLLLGELTCDLSQKAPDQKTFSLYRGGNKTRGAHRSVSKHPKCFPFIRADAVGRRRHLSPTCHNSEMPFALKMPASREVAPGGLAGYPPHSTQNGTGYLCFRQLNPTPYTLTWCRAAFLRAPLPAVLLRCTHTPARRCSSSELNPTQ